jgi:hypothetical protein
MKKLMKPLALLFVVAVSTGAFAQQDKPARPIKAQLKHAPAQEVQRTRVNTKAILVPNRKADIQRIVRRQGITTAPVKKS